MFSVTHFNYKKYLVLLLAMMMAACATSDKAVVIETDEIVISEEFGIDTDLSEKFNQAVIHIGNKNYETAIELLIEVTNKTKKHSAPYINLALAYSKTGKVQQAEKVLLRAIKINPQHPVTNNELGLLYRKTGRFSDAKKTYEKVIKIYPQFLPARKNLGILCDLFMKDLECAILHYEAFLKIQPKDKKVKIWLVDLKRRVNK